MKSIKWNYLILLLVLSSISLNVNAQFKAKKYKHAPDETIVVLIGQSNTTFDESMFPHLKFYYLPELKTEEAPDFITRFGTKKDFANPEMLNLLLIAKNAVVAYQNGYNKHMVASYTGDEFQFSILSKAVIPPDKKKLEDYLPDYITKENDAKIDKNKSFTKGKEPTFKDWADGDIVGLELPDFNVKTADGEEVAIKDVLNGKAGLIFFTGIKGDANYGSGNAYPLPMIWHIENVLYNYYPPRK
ncbi:MAG TPA: hypothetical protein DCG75_15500 [Bacteroidales bacterium]|nr:hypothetical protein [Bacteroidales bacterium]